MSDPFEIGDSVKLTVVIQGIVVETEGSNGVVEVETESGEHIVIDPNGPWKIEKLDI